jgi:protein TonB
MSQVARLSASAWLEEPRRFAWIAPLALALWLLLLFAFSRLLIQTAAPAPEANPIEARIIEIPAPSVPSSPAAAPAPAIKPQAPVTRRVATPLHPHHVPAKLHRLPPPVPASAEGTAKPQAEPSVAPAESASTGQSGAGATSSNMEGGGLIGNGSDNAGARATYAPVPEIPDDLREDALAAVAIAHFEIGDDGQARVTLRQPTENPRLNQLLLEALKLWRFIPATRNGVAISSQFDIRIPVTVN